MGGAITSKLQVLRHGHHGVLTTDFDAKADDKTTVRVTYTPPQPDTTRLVGNEDNCYFVCVQVGMRSRGGKEREREMGGGEKERERERKKGGGGFWDFNIPSAAQDHLRERGRERERET